MQAAQEKYFISALIYHYSDISSDVTSIYPLQGNSPTDTAPRPE